ncbi:MAG: carbohydrate ABC transporter permease [Clostridia bacterium]|nr:carbohydrate ABC transporter permease [Clostridia bacterium]
MKNVVTKENKIKKSKTQKIVFGVVFVIFFLYAIVLLYPLFFGFTASLIENGRVYAQNPLAISVPPHFNNYTKAFEELKVRGTDFFGMFVNSVWWSFGATVLTILSSAMMAYVVSRYDFRGKMLLYNMVLIVMIIPLYGTESAKYRLLQALNCLDSPLYLICAPWAFGTNFLLIYSFFKALPWSYSEAAFIDGAGHFYVFFRIMLPLALPSVAAVFVVGFIGTWNDYSTPLLYFPNMPTLASGLWQYERQMQYQANQPVYYAGALLSMIPLFAIFIGFQNTIMQKVYMGGLKG